MLKRWELGCTFLVMVVILQLAPIVQTFSVYIPCHLFQRPISPMGLFYGVPSMFDLIHRFKGQCIAYGGGTLVSLWSQAVSAAEKIPDIPIPEPAINDVVGIGGLLVITGRLFFDIFVYLDKRKQRKEEE